MADDGFHEIQLNSKQLIFLCMTAALVLVVAFLSGVLVGRGVRSEKEPSAVADAVAASATPASEPAAGVPAPAAQAAAPPAAAPPMPAEEDLTYDKRLEGKQPPKETLKPMTAAPPEPAKATPQTAPKETAKAAPAKDAPPVKDAAATKAAATPETAKSGFAEPAGTGYYLKIVAYRDRAQAEETAKRLNAKGYNTYVVVAANLYSVRAGKYKTRKEADSIRRRLEKEEQLKPLISH